MKSKEVIRRLLEIDPSGETEVVCEGADIHFIDSLPAYYDGSLRILIRDPSKAPSYDIIGMKETREGNKININTLGLQDVIFEDNDDKGIYQGGDRFMADVEKYRKSRNETVYNIDLRAFYRFIFEVNKFELAGEANHLETFFKFHEKQLRRRDFNSIGSSFNHKQNLYWADCVAVDKQQLRYIPGFENKEY